MRVRGWFPLPPGALCYHKSMGRIKSPDRKIRGFYYPRSDLTAQAGACAPAPPPAAVGSVPGPGNFGYASAPTRAAALVSGKPTPRASRYAALLRGRSSLAQPPAGGCPLRFLATPGASCAGAPAPAPPPAGRAARQRLPRASPRLFRPPGCALASLRASAVRATPAAPVPPSAPLRAPAASLWLPLLCSGGPLGFAGAAGPPPARALRASGPLASTPGGKGASLRSAPFGWRSPPGVFYARVLRPLRWRLGPPGAS